MSAVKAYQEKTYAADHFDSSESNYSKDKTIAILNRVGPLRESLLLSDHICPSSEAQECHHCACCLCSCWCREQGEPLDHQTSLLSFFHFKWQCLYNTGNLKPSPAHGSVGASTYPNLPRLPPCAAQGHQTPHPKSPRGDARRRLVWAKGREGAAQRDREGRGTRPPSCSLSGTDEIHIRCSVIKKQMTQCRAVFRRLALQLQMAHSRRSHQPPLHTHIPPFRNTHTHTHTQIKTHTQPSLLSPSGSEKRPRLKCFPVEVTT